VGAIRFTEQLDGTLTWMKGENNPEKTQGESRFFLGELVFWLLLIYLADHF